MNHLTYRARLIFAREQRPRLRIQFGLGVFLGATLAALYIVAIEVLK